MEKKRNNHSAYFVYVISKDGKPLCPTKRCGKVRRLLEAEKAKVVHRKPFTVQLLYETTGFTGNYTIDGSHVKNGVSYKKLKLVEKIKEILTQRLGAKHQFCGSQ